MPKVTLSLALILLLSLHHACNSDKRNHISLNAAMSRHDGCQHLNALCWPDAVELGHEFAAAKRDNRPPTINDLWEDDSPMGPYVLTALCARELHKRDVQYIVRDGEVKIVNSSTGRVLPQSRWMDELHQVCPYLPLLRLQKSL